MKSNQANDVAVLLINLGTPDAPEPSAVRRYLAEFLSDPRVVEIPHTIWKPVLHGVILNTRPKKSAHAYGLVEDPDSGMMRRTNMIMVGAYLAVTGNAMPRLLPPTSSKKTLVTSCAGGRSASWPVLPCGASR